MKLTKAQFNALDLLYRGWFIRFVPRNKAGGRHVCIQRPFGYERNTLYEPTFDILTKNGLLLEDETLRRCRTDPDGFTWRIVWFTLSDEGRELYRKEAHHRQDLHREGMKT